MRDLIVIAHALLVASIPFMFGVIVGRGFRSRKPTAEHILGEVIMSVTASIRKTLKYTGQENITVFRAIQVKADNEPDLFIYVSSKEPVQ